MFKGTIRPLQKEDIKSVEEIFDLYWNDSFRKNLSDKLEKYLANDSSLENENFEFFIAEENGEIVGVSAMRKAPEHIKKYSTTENPAEFYVLAVRIQGKGVGSAMTLSRIEKAKKSGYTEVLLFSGEKHKDSWKFHDKYFERIESAKAPNREAGYIWRKLI